MSASWFKQNKHSLKEDVQLKLTSFLWFALYFYPDFLLFLKNYSKQFVSL